ncbi:Bidirectional sugar transporter NEC1 [Linum grandiflorum]
MIMALQRPQLAFVFGILGNIVSFCVFLAPIPTFKKIVKEKSTQGFQSLPYLVALFSSTLYIYYAYLKAEDVFLIITINSFGCIIEILYLLVYIFYASSSVRLQTATRMLCYNGGAFGAIVGLTSLFFHDHNVRVNVVGWICAVFSVCVFAAPLNIIREVMKTRSVEFMPFTLSLFLTVCALFWLIYGLALGDYFIASPNIVGLGFGMIQMVLYWKYRNRNRGSSNQVLPRVDSSSRSSQLEAESFETDNEQKIILIDKDDIIIRNNLVVIANILQQDATDDDHEDNVNSAAVSIAMSKSEEEEEEEESGTDEELDV